MKKIICIKWQGLSCLSLSLLFLLFMLSSCQKQTNQTGENETIQNEDGVVISNLKCMNRQGSLVSSELVATFTVDQLKALSADYAPFAKYGINLYKISYLTRYKGEIIQVSGAVGIPILPKCKKAAIAIYTHGTMLTEGDDLPSKGTDPNTLITAASGFIVFAPDYIGYRDSKQIFHPYFINEASDAAVCDMIIAGQSFLLKNKIGSKPKLFLFGISQGGTVSLSAQKAIENDPRYKCKIHLTAVSSIVGVYEPNSLFMQPAIKDNNYNFPCFITYLILAYNEHYGFGKTLDQMFKNSNGQTFLNLKAQNKTVYEFVMGGFPVPMSDLFQDDFRQSLIAGTSEFNIAAAKNNTVYGWVPKTKLRIYYSAADDVVLPANSALAYNTFLAAGSKSVELVATPPLGHIGAGIYSFNETLTWFDSL